MIIPLSSKVSVDDILDIIITHNIDVRFEKVSDIKATLNGKEIDILENYISALQLF